MERTHRSRLSPVTATEPHRPPPAETPLVYTVAEVAKRLKVSAGTVRNTVGIPASRRTEYYDALATADHGELEPLAEIIANSELTTLGRTRHIAEAPRRRMVRIRELVHAAQEKVRRTEYLEYEVWRRRVDLLVEEFRRWLDDVN